MFGLKSKGGVKVVETSWREMLKEKEPASTTYPRSAPVPAPVEPLLDLAEYAALAADVGVTPPDMVIEGFKLFLSEHDIPVFNLGEVVRYMDKKAAAESAASVQDTRLKGHRMTGLYLLVLVGIAALFIAASRESMSINDHAPTAPPTKDAYDV